MTSAVATNDNNINASPAKRIGLPARFHCERQLRLTVRRYWHTPLQRVRIGPRALDALFQHFAFAPQAALADLQSRRLGARVAHEVFHRVARAPESSAILLHQSRLHRYVESFARLDGDFRA